MLPEREDIFYYLHPGTSTLTLNHTIVVAPNQTAVFFQNGQQVYAANQYYPYCRLELNKRQPAPQTLEPDTFVITETRLVSGLFAGISPVRLSASLSIFNSGEGKPSPITYGVEMDLQSSKQPQVKRLMCGHLQDPNIEARYPSIDQVGTSLGNLMTFRPSLKKFSKAEFSNRYYPNLQIIPANLC